MLRNLYWRIKKISKSQIFPSILLIHLRLAARKEQNKKYLDEIKSYEKQKKSLNMKIGVIQDFFAKKDVKGSFLQ